MRYKLSRAGGHHFIAVKDLRVIARSGVGVPVGPQEGGAALARALPDRERTAAQLAEVAADLARRDLESP